MFKVIAQVVLFQLRRLIMDDSKKNNIQVGALQSIELIVNDVSTPNEKGIMMVNSTFMRDTKMDAPKELLDELREKFPPSWEKDMEYGYFNCNYVNDCVDIMWKSRESGKISKMRIYTLSGAAKNMARKMKKALGAPVQKIKQLASGR